MTNKINVNLSAHSACAAVFRCTLITMPTTRHKLQLGISVIEVALIFLYTVIVLHCITTWSAR